MLKIQQIFPKLYKCLLYVVFHNLEPQNAGLVDVKWDLHYTGGQVSVYKRISVLSNYFDVSFEIYYVRLKYIDSIGQVVKILI